MQSHFLTIELDHRSLIIIAFCMQSHCSKTSVCVQKFNPEIDQNCLFCPFCKFNYGSKFLFFFKYSLVKIEFLDKNQNLAQCVSIAVVKQVIADLHIPIKENFKGCLLAIFKYLISKQKCNHAKHTHSMAKFSVFKRFHTQLNC